ncbi:sensor histidine kinase [Luteimonas aquatica]|uniref:sensor histidine kinase n=1 Tax=Luteimonas aquatica TaxID=450364 RepID=UPI001F5AAF24|nr:sensor histidine kinase [Luteimonas aquatica]
MSAMRTPARTLLPRSTSVRLAVAVATAFLLACVLLGGGVYLAVSALLDDDAREVVRAEAGGLAATYRQSGRDGLLAEIRRRVAAPDDPDTVYALVAGDGRVLAGSYARLPVRHGLHAGRRQDWIEFHDDTTDGAPRVLANLFRLADGETLLTGLRTRSEDGFLALMLDSALVALLVATALGALVGGFTARWVSRRLRSLDATAARVGAGELGLRAPVDGSDDAFDRLAHRFNAMLDRIEDLLGGVRHATDHIAHDLRTPLTRLRHQLEQLRQRALARSGAEPELDAAIAESDQLLQSFGALLRLARIEAQPMLDAASPEQAPRVDLQAIARDALEMYAPIAAQRGIVLRERTAPAPVHGDADQLFQLLVNLLDNAIKFAPEGSAAELSVAAGAQSVQLEIADRGPGIAEADRERVLDRFVRLEAHRGSPGTGLGLSLVRAIARRHDARIELLDNAPGLRVRIVFPAA